MQCHASNRWQKQNTKGKNKNQPKYKIANKMFHYFEPDFVYKFNCLWFYQVNTRNWTRGTILNYQEGRGNRAGKFQHQERSPSFHFTSEHPQAARYIKHQMSHSWRYSPDCLFCYQNRLEVTRVINVGLETAARWDEKLRTSHLNADN